MGGAADARSRYFEGWAYGKGFELGWVVIKAQAFSALI